LVRLEPIDLEQPIVVALDVERRRLVAEHRDLARTVCLDPDRRVALADVPQ
jgi:hypothetical protein